MACFGGKELEGQLKKHFNEFKDFQNHINIAVAGRSGAGKSSFINAIRGITAEDLGAAEVDVRECNIIVQMYIYPGNDNIRIYELPSLGTLRSPKSTYLADVNFEQYDLFIILTESRFMNEDLWLAQQVEEKGKHFYFVRSKIDNDIRSNKRAHPRTFNEAALLNVIKENLESNLQMFSRKDIFLIDIHDTQSYEFGRLTSKLIQDSNKIRQYALVCSSTYLSKVIAAGAFVNVLEPADSSFVSNEATASFDVGLKEKVKQLKSYYYRGGIPGLERQIKKQLNEWKDAHIKIAVTGRSGVGKSSFINAIRGITADDAEAAEVDVKECTTSVREYLYPDNDNIRIYDLPGLGTPKFQQSTYLADVNFEQYDFFIIFTETRFMNEDLWLAEQAEEQGKSFYFVRSKIDNAVRSDKQAHPRTHNEAALLNVIKEDLESKLERFSRKDIFLIDNYNTQSYEFGRLTSKLIQDSDEIRQDVLAFSLACLSNEVIEDKKKILQRRIPLVSTFVGAFANIMDPADSIFVLQEVHFYGQQFRVDTTSLAVGGVVCDLSEDERETVDALINSHNKIMSEKSRQSLDHVTRYIPIAGNIAVGIKCAKYLAKCLNETAQRAKEIHGLMTERLAKKYAL